MIGRRAVLCLGATAAGGLLAGCGVSWPDKRLGAPADFAGPPDEVVLNAWVRIAPDGRVVVAVPRAEMGQGVHTALAMVVAEELGALWEQVSVQPVTQGGPHRNELAVVSLWPLDDADTGGVAEGTRWALRWSARALALNLSFSSSSVRDAWMPMRWAGAAAREQLLQAGAQRLEVDAAQCRAEDGYIVHGASGRRVAFSQVAAAAAQRPAPESLVLRPSATFGRVGRATGRLDSPAVVRGAQPYGSDVPLEGLLHAAITQCPVIGGRLLAFDPAPALAQPGVRDAFALDPHTVVVVADRFWRAHQALQRLSPVWDDAAGAPVSSEAVMERLRRAAAGDVDRAAGRASGASELPRAEGVRRLNAEYEVPFLAHAALEPLNCTALFDDRTLTLWCATQVPPLACLQAARAAGVWPAQVRLHPTAMGGGFGRRIETDVIVQAARIARRLPGTPVRLQWTREEDTAHDAFRPAAVSRIEAALDADGRPAAWWQRVATPSVVNSYTERLAGGPVPALPDRFLIEGAFDLPYAIAHLKVQPVRVPVPVPVGFWRSVGHSINAFSVECFVDELAQAAGVEALTYRRGLLLQRPRHLAVLELAAARASWGAALPAGRARGLAVHSGWGSVCAMVAEVSMRQGRPHVHQLTCAVDCGRVVNPLGAQAQVEGAVAFGLGAVLTGEVVIEAGRVQAASLQALGVLPMVQMPAVQVHFVPSELPPQGLGEVAVPPVAPAVVNALSALLGRRIRRLPLSRAL